MLTTTLTSRFPEVRLLARRRAALASALSAVPYPTGPDDEAFIRRSHRAAVRFLPEAVVRELDRLKDDPHPPAALRVRGAPIDPFLPPTPSDGRTGNAGRTRVAEAFLLAVARYLGQPYSYRVEKNGDLVHTVAPVAGKERSLTNMGSVDELGFHTELAYFPQPPRWLILLCLRADHERAAATPLADVRDALDILDPRYAAELRQPQFRVRCPFIFDPMFGPDQLYSPPRPVLTGPPDSPDMRVALYGDLAQPATPAGRDALAALDAAVRAVARPIKLTPGDLVVLSNHIVLHARTSFTPRFDGADRWLLRVHVADSLWPFRGGQCASYRVLD